MVPALETPNKPKTKRKAKAYGFVDKYVLVKNTRTYQPDGRVEKPWTTLRSELPTALPHYLASCPQSHRPNNNFLNNFKAIKNYLVTK